MPPTPLPPLPQGPYVRRTIPNPHYYDEKAPLDNMAAIWAVAIEVGPGYRNRRGDIVLWDKW